MMLHKMSVNDTNILKLYGHDHTHTHTHKLQRTNVLKSDSYSIESKLVRLMLYFLAISKLKSVYSSL